MNLCKLARSVVMIAAFGVVHLIVLSQSWQSAIVHDDGTGRLIYASDTQGNRIPDFSYAGYRNGDAPIPFVTVVDSVGPIAGDNTLNIQNAINRVKARTPDASGFRGTLYLKPGAYRVSGTLVINGSGIVLRGAGEEADTLANTVIIATGDSASQTTVIIAGGGNTGSNSSAWSGASSSNVNIMTDTVHVGDRTFTVVDAGSFNVGDNIVIAQPQTLAWLRAINFGGVPLSNGKPDTGTSSYWASQNLIIPYNRFITAINGNTITIDAPIFTTLVRSLSQAYCYKTNRSGILTNIGIERLRVDIINPYNDSPLRDGNEHDHASSAVWMGKIEDGWIRHCTALHFTQSGFKTSIATRVTIDSCTAIDPISIITGERRYNFDTDFASQLILFSNCTARYARHACVSNGTSGVSGVVFFNCSSEGSFNSSEGHRLWSQGLLYDNYRDFNSNVSASSYVLGLYNRGNYGSGHGWAAVHSVAWNCNTGTRGLIIQKPPTAQNYAIGCIGTVSGLCPPAPFNQPQGYIEGTGKAGVFPQSLYQAQLAARHAGLTGVGEPRTTCPTGFHLEQNYPNPFNPSTTIGYTVPVHGRTVLKIYDIIGNEVTTLVDETKNAGAYSVRFDARELPSGVYFSCLRSNAGSAVMKMILMK